MEEPFRLVDLIELNFCPICFMIYSTASYAAIFAAVAHWIRK
jgi:hypothetical protein